MAAPKFTIETLFIYPSGEWRVSTNWTDPKKYAIPQAQSTDGNTLKRDDPAKNVFAFSLPAVPADPSAKWSFPMVVWGLLSPEATTWAATLGSSTRFVAQASLRGQPFFQSDPFEMQKANRGIYFRAESFHLIPKLAYGLPFCYTGEWKFTVIPEPASGLKPAVPFIEEQSLYTIEAYFLPNSPMAPFLEHVPAELLRKVALPGDWLATHDSEITKDPTNQPYSPAVFYGRHCIQWIWDHGFNGVPGTLRVGRNVQNVTLQFKYDRQSDFNMTKDGEKGKGRGSLFTGFALGDWLMPRKEYSCANCYDLSGIVQLCLKLFGQVNGKEVIRTQWVYCQPMGFSKPCYLFGTKSPDNGKLMKLDTPYLTHEGSALSTDYTGSKLDEIYNRNVVGAGSLAIKNYIKASKEPEDIKTLMKQTAIRDKLSFDNHAFIEAELRPGEPFTVFDATIAKPRDGPLSHEDFIAGQYTREQYFQEIIDENVVTPWAPDTSEKYRAGRKACLENDNPPKKQLFGCTGFFPLGPA